jgi:hypothetical protein
MTSFGQHPGPARLIPTGTALPLEERSATRQIHGMAGSGLLRAAAGSAIKSIVVDIDLGAGSSRKNDGIPGRAVRTRSSAGRAGGFESSGRAFESHRVHAWRKRSAGIVPAADS